MKAQCLSIRKQRVKLVNNIGGVLKAGITGWIVPNKKSKLAKDTVHTPPFLFRPDTNPELAFLVFAREIEVLVNSPDQRK